MPHDLSRATRRVTGAHDQTGIQRDVTDVKRIPRASGGMTASQGHRPAVGRGLYGPEPTQYTVSVPSPYPASTHASPANSQRMVWTPGGSTIA